MRQLYPFLHSSRANSNTVHFGYKGVLEKPSIGNPRIPAIVFSIYQLMFAAIT